MIYFYGGAFNPMTISHLDIIKNISKELNDNDTLIIAITNHDYKKYFFNYNLRNNIVTKNLELVLSNKINYKIIEQNQRTWKFLNSLQYKDENITLIVGEDEYNDLKNYKWHYSKDILDLYKIIVIPRTDNISSTVVREMLKENKNFDELKNYITKETYDILKRGNYINE